MCALPLLGALAPAHGPDFRDPNSVATLVTPRIALPRGFQPRRLVVPNVRFTFTGFAEKRQVRDDVAGPLRRLFAAASADGVPLAGVSGYRSEATQRSLYADQVARDGRQQADRVVARPRHSEHETGLAIDVSGADGRCQAEACFAGTREARWIAAHAPDYGFIVRYPKGAEAITGYEYEPWHLRYVGVRLAREVAASGVTLDEFLGAR
ncbi:M15 family metallopeptidase [Solirubrobacter ginsenosidimutans]|uniref:M15 family metallopeptidase n=1 Tax=Solirubrobacter ginsenosidimutans TaxID=490573 RepID=A0A9X3N0G2_9ACTN|nr:M15 family metallopeptidase [Solirubrobacter ginsenosidimutans]MDA0165942.1 M15 family metallopeptidase [Solirubrobacter ginsenosidimutans]